MLNYSSYFMDEKKLEVNPLLFKVLEFLTIKKRNVLIIGSGGVGKTVMAGQIYDRLITDFNVIKTAPTGTAAHIIGGTTIHRTFGLTPQDEDSQAIVMKLLTLYKDKVEIIRGLDFIILDEVSMMGGNAFSKIDEIARAIRRSKEVLGGIRILLIGDFCQLEPVNDIFLFLHPVWKRLKLVIVKLTKPMRYVDHNHYDFLQRVRIGKLNADDIEKLKKRHEAYKSLDLTQLIQPTILYPRKKDVLKENLAKLKELDTEEMDFECKDVYYCEGDPPQGAISEKGKITSIPDLERQMDDNVPKSLKLKVGAQVMLTKNMSIDEGLVNGSRGVVIGFDDKCVIVRFRNDKDVFIERNEYKVNYRKIKYVRFQFPLILAWALTIHKIQGASLDYVILDIGKSMFVPGLGYVALSRARSLEGIFIKEFDVKRIKANEDALRLEEELNKK